MSITIVIPTPLRQFTGGNSEIEVQAATAGDALLELTATHTELRKHLYNDQNNLRNFINVYVGDEDIRHLNGAATLLKDGETIMIVPSMRAEGLRQRLDLQVNCLSFLTTRSHDIRVTSSCRKSV